ncbi:hypothetical protein [Demequina sp. NBRC 110055]|uniref:hypothetical protein n=1 Tax=Demequina sp. NBRC 110055 TaxID=1570344 RepID=UPI000A0602E5|nr:hypothetical protein [Demequina sp. NBRC 110055]
MGALADALPRVASPTATVRRIVVTSLVAGAGTTTVASLLTRTLARHRSGPVLLTSPAIAGRTDHTVPWHGASLGAALGDDRSFDVSVVDRARIGDPAFALPAVADATIVVIVSTWDRAVGEDSLALADALAAHPDGCASMVVFTNGGRSRSPWSTFVAERHPRASASLPYDEALTMGQLERASIRTRIAAVTAAGDAMTATREGLHA